jgi:hypothetical protein
MGVGGQHHAWLLHPRERPGTRCIGGWVGPGDGLDRCGKSRPHRDAIADRPARSVSLYRLSDSGLYAVSVQDLFPAVCCAVCSNYMLTEQVVMDRNLML